ncbi:MAG: helix-turn-helix domain-containing protein [Nitrospiraceae bacterium]|nr:helix-turn-helix domain-containing protein [Nitrospiraceae bacterium]
MGKLKMLKSEKSIGELIRQMRKSSGLSQMQLAEKVGISYQQVQKYEKGVNKLSLSRLKQISGALGVPASLFLDEEDPLMSGEQTGISKAKLTGLLNDEARLLMLFRKVHSKKLKHGFIEILEDVVNISNGRKN